MSASKGGTVKTISIGFVWKIRLALRAEGDKLWAEGSKLRAEGNKLWAEGDKLRAEGDKLWAEGDKLWAEAVIESYGNVTIEWITNGKCIVNGTDTYGE